MTFDAVCFYLKPQWCTMMYNYLPTTTLCCGKIILCCYVLLLSNYATPQSSQICPYGMLCLFCFAGCFTLNSHWAKAILSRTRTGYLMFLWWPLLRCCEFRRLVSGTLHKRTSGSNFAWRGHREGDQLCLLSQSLICDELAAKPHILQHFCHGQGNLSRRHRSLPYIRWWLSFCEVDVW